MPLARSRPADITSGATHVGEVPIVPEKVHLLTLPSPREVLGPEESNERGWFSWPTWAGGTGKKRRRSSVGSRKERRTWGVLGMRILRSSVLVVKVLTIPRLCTDPTTRPRPVIAALLLALALMDTVVDHQDFTVDDRQRKPSISREREKTTIGGTNVLHSSGLRRVGSGIWISLGLGLLHFAVLGLSNASSSPGAAGDIWSRTCCIPIVRG